MESQKDNIFVILNMQKYRLSYFFIVFIFRQCNPDNKIMNINKPLLKVQRARLPSRQSNITPSGQKKKTSQDDAYLLELIRDLEEVETNWGKLLKSSDNQIERAKRQKIQIENDEAFLHCQNLIDEEYQASQANFGKVRRQLKVALKTVEEHIQVCEKEKQKRAAEIQNLKSEVDQLENEETNFGKKAKRKHQIREKVDDYTRQIEAAAVRLQAAKQKSYEQKQLYTKTQELQRNLIDQIARIEDQQRYIHDNKGRQKHYKQLKHMAQKLRAKSKVGSKQVQGYLKQKINSMAHLRTNLLNLDDKISQYNNSLQQQHYVIEGLKRKARDQVQQDDSLFRKYQSKYEKMYFSRNNDVNNWKDYKSYLQEQLKQNQGSPLTRYPRRTYTRNDQTTPVTGSPLRRSSEPHHYSRLKTEPGLTRIDEEEQQIRSQDRYLQNEPQLRVNRSLYRDQSLRLPKLIKTNRRPEDSDRIRERVKQALDDSNVSLESVQSNDMLSGEFIEVQLKR